MCPCSEGISIWYGIVFSIALLDYIDYERLFVARCNMSTANKQKWQGKKWNFWLALKTVCIKKFITFFKRVEAVGNKVFFFYVNAHLSLKADFTYPGWAVQWTSVYLRSVSIYVPKVVVVPFETFSIMIHNMGYAVCLASTVLYMTPTLLSSEPVWSENSETRKADSLIR